MKQALPRGLWDDHLRDVPGLRELDDDTWDAVDKAAPLLDKRFAAWIANRHRQDV